MNYATTTAVTFSVVAIGWYISSRQDTEPKQVIPDITLEKIENVTEKGREISEPEKIVVQTSLETLCDDTVSDEVADPTPIVTSTETPNDLNTETSNETPIELPIEMETDKLTPSLSSSTLSQTCDPENKPDEVSSKTSEAVTGSFIILNTEDCEKGSVGSLESHKKHSEKMEDEYYDLTEEERLKLSDIRTSKLEKLELERKLRMLQMKRQQEREVAEREAIMFDKLRNVPSRLSR